jgi:hypothetical protein
MRVRSGTGGWLRPARLGDLAFVLLSAAPGVCWSAPTDECHRVAEFVTQRFGARAIDPVLRGAPAIPPDWRFKKQLQGGPLDTPEMRELLARSKAPGRVPNLNCSTDFIRAGVPLAINKEARGKARFGFTRVLASRQGRFVLFAYGYSKRWGRGFDKGQGAVVMERSGSGWRVVADERFSG